MVEYQEIIIDWDKTIPITNEVIQKMSNNEDYLYQIYGNHHIYGRNILLYIGKTTNVKKRFEAHLKGVFGYVNELKISLGKVSDSTKISKLEIPESILIANHKPAFNKEYIHNVDTNANHKIIIINNGSNNMLQTCSTNFWWIDGKKN